LSNLIFNALQFIELEKETKGLNRGNQSKCEQGSFHKIRRVLVNLEVVEGQNGVAEPPPWATGLAGLEVAEPPPGQMVVAGHPMWPKGMARPPQQFLFFKKKTKSLK
jgi:hypothetical protein